MSERRMRIGGLLRCCAQSIAEYEGSEVPGETRIACKFHEEGSPSDLLLASDGVWEWHPIAGYPSERWTKERP